MLVYCAQCGKEALVPPTCTADNWPVGWHINLSRNGEVCLCSHACASTWHKLHAARGDSLAGTIPMGRRLLLS